MFWLAVGVLQAEGSCYEFVEARVGGSLTRHDLGVQQDGSDTTTTMKHFILAGEHMHLTSQLQGCLGVRALGFDKIKSPLHAVHDCATSE